MSGAVEFGRLPDVMVRQTWAHEALGFTPWLAQNFDWLDEALGVQLEHFGFELAVTCFAADTLTCNVTDGITVLIENQSEVSYRGHRGQILTYLSETVATNLGISLDPGADCLFLKAIPRSYVEPGERDRLIPWFAAETERYATARVNILGETH